jgi:hypothetical protein
MPDESQVASRPGGRPSSYSAPIADEIVRRIAEGDSLKRICAGEGMPAVQTVLRWAGDDIDGFKDRYTHAIQARAHLLAEEIIDLADAAGPEDTQARRLQVDARKWIASKFWPKVFGDRIHTDVQQLDKSGNPTDPAAINVMAAAAAKLSSTERKALIALYRKMGARLPHEPPLLQIESQQDD